MGEKWLKLGYLDKCYKALSVMKEGERHDYSARSKAES